MSKSFISEPTATEDMRKWRATLPDKGKDWTPDVWENLGWHWCLMLGPVSVYRGESNGKPYFHAMIASDVDQARHGSVKWSHAEHGKTPLEAAQNAVKKFKEYRDAERALLDRMTKFLDEHVA